MDVIIKWRKRCSEPYLGGFRSGKIPEWRAKQVHAKKFGSVEEARGWLRQVVGVPKRVWGPRDIAFVRLEPRAGKATVAPVTTMSPAPETKKTAKDRLVEAAMLLTIAIERAEPDLVETSKAISDQRKASLNYLKACQYERERGRVLDDATPAWPKSVAIQVETSGHKWRTVCWTTVLYADREVILVRQYGAEALYHTDGSQILAGHRPGHPGAENLPTPLWCWRMHPASVASVRAWLEAS